MPKTFRHEDRTEFIGKRWHFGKDSDGWDFSLFENMIRVSTMPPAWGQGGRLYFVQTRSGRQFTNVHNAA